ncbi:MAG: proline iminopeptidase-family hydrolase [Candidatus Methanomethylophilaceae archaeon]|nr:proline iminopeptidase-family hydrolase [Candidatus Methanomethylophilaceae archaeon]
MKEIYIRTENGRIWCSVYGEDRDGTPLLVVHGGPGFLSMPQTVSDLSADRPVYFYDQLGCGRSDRAADPGYYTLENYVKELDFIRGELGLYDVFLAGFSWGSGLICSYVLDRGAEGIRGLILSGPLLSSPHWEKDQRRNVATMPEVFVGAIEEGERKGDYDGPYNEAVMEYYRRFVCRLDPWPEHFRESLDAINMDVYLSMWGPSEFTVTGTLKNFDLYPRLTEVRVPVLLTCGDNDEAGVKTVKDFQTAFPDARMAVIPGSSHMHHIERPGIYLAVVNSFLDDTERRSADP